MNDRLSRIRESEKKSHTETEDWVWQFVGEAQKRGIFTPGDMKLI